MAERVTCPINSHYNDVIMGGMASQITSLTIVYSTVCSWTVCSGIDQRKHQSSAPLAFVRGIHRWPVNSLHKGQVTWKMFLFDDAIMTSVYPLPVVGIPDPVPQPSTQSLSSSSGGIVMRSQPSRFKHVASVLQKKAPCPMHKTKNKGY